MADRSDSAVLVPVAHRPLRGCACAVVAGAGGSRHDGGDDDPRHLVLCGGLAPGGFPWGGPFCVAPPCRLSPPPLPFLAGPPCFSLDFLPFSRFPFPTPF